MYARGVSVVELVDDLLTLERLAAQEDDPDRRRSLDIVRSHLADREGGAKVSEVATVLGLSQPTVRAWIESGLLEPIPGATPRRVDLVSVADVKRALDLIRRDKDDRRLLADVMRLLRDAASAGEDADVVPLASVIPGSDLVEAGVHDLGEGRCSIPALLVSIGAPRLRQLGFEVTSPIEDADHALYELLAAEDADSAHGRYNALVRRLVSFERAATCVG